MSAEGGVPCYVAIELLAFCLERGVVWRGRFLTSPLLSFWCVLWKLVVVKVVCTVSNREEK